MKLKCIIESIRHNIFEIGTIAVNATRSSDGQPLIVVDRIQTCSARAGHGGITKLKFKGYNGYHVASAYKVFHKTIEDLVK